MHLHDALGVVNVIYEVAAGEQQKSAFGTFSELGAVPNFEREDLDRVLPEDLVDMGRGARPRDWPDEEVVLVRVLSVQVSLV